MSAERLEDLAKLLEEWIVAERGWMAEFSGDLTRDTLALLEKAKIRYALHGLEFPESLRSQAEGLHREISER